MRGLGKRLALADKCADFWKLFPSTATLDEPDALLECT